MKHKITLLVSLCVVTFAVGSAVNTHRDYIHQLTLENAISAAQHARQAATQKAQEQLQSSKAHDQLMRLQKACDDGLDAYRLLTTVQQKHVAAPACLIQ